MKYTELTFTELVNKIGSSRYFDLPKMLKEILSRLAPQAPKYKVYTALLTQSGTDAPVATVLENTLGGTPVWSYIGVGYYGLTLQGAFEGNITVRFGNEGNTEITALYFSGDKTNDSIQIYISEEGNVGLGNNGRLLDTSIEIEVYL